MARKGSSDASIREAPIETTASVAQSDTVDLFAAHERSSSRAVASAVDRRTLALVATRSWLRPHERDDAACCGQSRTCARGGHGRQRAQSRRRWSAMIRPVDSTATGSPKWLSDRDANAPLPILGGAVLKRTLIELFATLR